VADIATLKKTLVDAPIGEHTLGYVLEAWFSPFHEYINQDERDEASVKADDALGKLAAIVLRATSS
jgi:hypothetical protein